MRQIQPNRQGCVGFMQGAVGLGQGQQAGEKPFAAAGWALQDELRFGLSPEQQVFDRQAIARFAGAESPNRAAARYDRGGAANRIWSVARYCAEPPKQLAFLLRPARSLE